MQDKPALVHAIKKHDAAVAKTDLTVWLGAEPTFTDRSSEAPEWLRRAEGGDKSLRALAMLKRYCQDRSNPLVLRTIGRLYPGEKAPRWNHGIYESRNHHAVWRGPPDPALGGVGSFRQVLESFPRHLSEYFIGRGWKSHHTWNGDQSDWRIVFRVDGTDPPDFGLDDRLSRPSIHSSPIPEAGLCDALANDGNYLFLFRYPIRDRKFSDEEICHAVPSLELPSFPNVSLFLDCVAEIGKAATDCGLGGLTLEGFSPPVDASVAWTTFTPDPAVIEVNMAPAKDASEFYDMVSGIFQAGENSGLSPYRFYYNGDATDSGGGGQITFGGPSARASPFFLRPWLLPNVVRYFNRHPGLSFFFTPSCVGSSSQSPRPDERFRESFEEMCLALELLSQQSHPSPDAIWGSLAPFLSDPSGNNHRSEINVEKLWNPLLAGRGCLGLVEFRAFRMARTPEVMTARAVLFRSLLAMLAKEPDSSRLIDWGAELHDRFALPFYLKRDLNEVFDELADARLGLDEPLQELILDDGDRLFGEAILQDCQLTVHRALEFWPLVGDVASQESGNSRLVDSSTTRIQVILRPLIGSQVNIRDWCVAYQNWRMPVRFESDETGPLMIFAFKYRTFAPWRGLHPTLPPQSPIELTLQNTSSLEVWKLVLHEWNPQGGAYENLPEDWAESLLRRKQRLVCEKLPMHSVLPLEEPPPTAVSPYCLDIRVFPFSH